MDRRASRPACRGVRVPSAPVPAPAVCGMANVTFFFLYAAGRTCYAGPNLAVVRRWHTGRAIAGDVFSFPPTWESVP
jgi:hypothetical protein